MPEVGAGVTTIRKEGDTPLEADIELAAGTNVTLTQAGQKITIAASGGGASVPVKEDNVQVVASMTVLDFGSGFDVTESPAGEANVDLDFSEKAPTHAQLGSVTADQHHAEAHNLLSTPHGDTTPASVVAGDLVVGDATPKWARLAKGTATYVLKAGAAVLAWGQVAFNELTGAISATQHGALGAITNAHAYTDISGVPALFYIKPPSGAYLFPNTLTLSATATEALANNTVRAYPIWVGANITAIQIGMNCTTAVAGTPRLAIYTDSSGYPGSLILDAGTINTGTTGVKTIAISQAITGGQWIWVVYFSDTTATMRAGGVSPDSHQWRFINTNTDPTSANIFVGYGGTYTYPVSAPSTFPASIAAFYGTSRAAIILGV